NTSITSVLPVLSLLVVGSLILGATTLQEFAIALLIGLLVGGYSSLFVAMPFVAATKGREAHWVEVAKAAESVGSHETLDAANTALAAEHYSRTKAPRPRKQGKRR
ncbi:MAG: protein translocase subunit SecF, partial [Actinomycetota bacterium]|nr:protein translocase subunit SecF [Actinomycetota bacterium]